MPTYQHNSESFIQCVLIIPGLQAALKFGFVTERFRQSPYYCSDVAGSNPDWGVLIKSPKRPKSCARFRIQITCETLYTKKPDSICGPTQFHMTVEF